MPSRAEIGTGLTRQIGGWTQPGEQILQLQRRLTRSVRRQAVDLVEGRHHRFVIGAQLLQHVDDRLHLLGCVRMGDVDDVHEHRRLVDLLQRGAEGGDEQGGQVVDEADGVGEEHLPAAGNGAAPRGGIEGGEELVLGHHRRSGQRVEQRALAGVGVADEGDDRDRHVSPAVTVVLAMGMDVTQLALDVDDPFAELAAVAFELGLTGTAQTDAADALAGEVSPEAGQPRQPVFELGQLDLEAPLVGRRAAGEDIENQSRPVDDLDVERALEVALLGRESDRRRP